MSISTGRSGSGNATSPPNTSSPRIAAASNASAFSRFSSIAGRAPANPASAPYQLKNRPSRSEEHTSELQSLAYLVCRLLLEKKKKTQTESRQQVSQHPKLQPARLLRASLR